MNTQDGGVGITDHRHDVADADLLRQRVTCNIQVCVSAHGSSDVKLLGLPHTGGSEVLALRVVTLLVPNFLFQVHNDPAEMNPSRVNQTIVITIISEQ